MLSSLPTLSFWWIRCKDRPTCSCYSLNVAYPTCSDDEVGVGVGRAATGAKQRMQRISGYYGRMRCVRSGFPPVRFSRRPCPFFFWRAPASPLRHLLFARGAHLSNTSSFSLRIPGARQLYPASHPARPGGARLPQTSAAYQRACPGVPSLRRDRAKPAGQCHTLPRGPWSCTSSTTPWTGSTLM